MNRNAPVKSLTLIIIILFAFSFCAFLILNAHYVAVGECAAIVYYKPLTIWDRIVFVVIGIACIIFSVKAVKPKRASMIVLCGAYIAIISVFSIFGNQLLEMRKEYWPHEYHPQPIDSTQGTIFHDKDL